ncbi:hypothetical protein TWF281_003805 [Arthrobotrys megalospora]
MVDRCPTIDSEDLVSFKSSFSELIATVHPDLRDGVFDYLARQVTEYFQPGQRSPSTDSPTNESTLVENTPTDTTPPPSDDEELALIDSQTLPPGFTWDEFANFSIVDFPPEQEAGIEGDGHNGLASLDEVPEEDFIVLPEDPVLFFDSLGQEPPPSDDGGFPPSITGKGENGIDFLAICERINSVLTEIALEELSSINAPTNDPIPREGAYYDSYDFPAIIVNFDDDDDDAKPPPYEVLKSLDPPNHEPVSVTQPDSNDEYDDYDGDDEEEMSVGELRGGILRALNVVHSLVAMLPREY